jgi:regulatory protein
VIKLKITNIKKLANNKYKITLENGDDIITYDEVILKNNLLFLKELDDEIIKKIEKDNNYYSVYNDTLKYISKRIRSKKEIIEYLNKKSLKEEDILKIVTDLEEKDFINDKIFCSSFVSDKFYLSHMGPLKIEKELENYNIDSNYIIESISSISKEDIYDLLYKMIDKKIKCNHKYSRSILKQKIVSYFGEQGYDKDTIINIFDELYKEDESLLKKEYEKVRQRLSKKYEGKELDYKIISSLYQKGFLKEDIDKIKYN